MADLWETTDDMPPELRELHGKFKKKRESSESARQPYLDRWERYYALYRNYRRLVVDRPDIDDWREVQREWGAELFIPYCFATIETLVPRVLAKDPQMQVKPLEPAAQAATEPISQLFEQRQAQIGYAHRLQPTVRQGLKYGLGVSKTYYEDRRKTIKFLSPSIHDQAEQKNLVQDEREVPLSVGPTSEFVDVFDFFWDPNAWDIETSEYAIHRTIRSWEYVKRMFEQGKWGCKLALGMGDDTTPLVDLEKLEGMGSATTRSGSLEARMKYAGVEDFNVDRGKSFEVWEYHDREEVITVICGLVVQRQPAFWHGELPFQIYRPTIQEGEFVGIGEIEPIAHLQYELNTLRSQRRDNATLVLQKAFMYTEGLVDPEDLVIGPGVGIPVQSQNLGNVLRPIEIGEIPMSGYQEEEALKADIERTVGVSDTVAGGDAQPGDTATGIQLIQSAANIRVQLKAKNLDYETIIPQARQWLGLWRQYSHEPQPIRIEDPAGGYTFDEVTPGTLAANVEPIPVSGSTEPENLPQRRNDAMVTFNQLNGNQEVNQRKLIAWLLGEYGVAGAEDFLAPEQPVLDPNLVGRLLVEQAGMDQEAALAVIQNALQMSAQQQDAEQQRSAA